MLDKSNKMWLTLLLSPSWSDGLITSDQVHWVHLPRNVLLWFLGDGDDVIFSRGLCTWSREIVPSSRLMDLMWIDSFIFLLKVLASLFRTLAHSQLIMWLSWAMWSVMADLWNCVVDSFLIARVNFLLVISSVSFWCSFILVPKGRHVFMMLWLVKPFARDVIHDLTALTNVLLKAKSIDRDEGAISLDHVYNPLLRWRLCHRLETTTSFPASAVDLTTCDQTVWPRWRKLKCEFTFYWISQA